MTRFLTAWMGAAAIAMAVTAAPSGEQAAPSASDKVRISGWALNMSNIKTGANQTIRITTDGWSNHAM